MTSGSKLINFIVYKQTPLEKFLERTIPYLPFIFKDLRERVRCKWRFKYAYLQRVDDDLMSVLSTVKAKPIDLSEVDIMPFEWEISLKRNECGTTE